MNLSSLIFRHYTKALEGSDQSVYDLFEWKTVDVIIKDYSTGKNIVEMLNLEFPVEYSQSACDIIASKYFRKKGIENEQGCEHSMKQLCHRMVNFWVMSAADEGLISKEEEQIVYDELAYMLLKQIWAPNSPQWFNTGLKHAYGLKGKAQGHYFFDEEKNKVVLSKDAYSKTQGSACFIISIEDSLLGEKSLTDQLTTETLLFKYGSGVGTNWSTIRSKNELLSGGGKSSGLLSFLKVSDRNAGAIKSGGTTRRAAKMNILNLDHPEILDFIRWKANEEDKVEALGKMGYNTHFDGEAYETVSGQNANNSVRIPNEFMEKLNEKDSIWQLKGRIDSAADKEIKVSDIWDAIAKAAWRCGDPGVQFDDIINAWHTAPGGEDGQFWASHNRINASNPCSEYMFLDDTACNLASINVAKFYDDEKNEFDVLSYLHSIKLIQIVLEATIHWGQFPTADIARKSYQFRTTGLGLTNLGMLFMQMAFAYDSSESRNFAAGLMSLLTGYSYYISSLMAKAVGAFPSYKINEQAMLRVINNHAKTALPESELEYNNMPYQPVKIDHQVLISAGFREISNTLATVWKDCLRFGKEFGYRNAQVSVLAPTGTIAFAMDCATTSSEPFFSHVVYKKLVGGSMMEIINPALPLALKRLQYSESEINDIVAYVMRKEKQNDFEMIADGKIEGAPHLKEEHLPIFDTANICGSGKRYILPSGHVKMMGALTPHVSGAISKTVNMPKEATVKDIQQIYQLSWELGVKAIALYRDSCKVSQPLNSGFSDSHEKDFNDYSYQELIEFIKNNQTVYKPIRIKPKGIRKARVHEAAIDGLKLYITTSFYEDGKLGELYVSSGRQGSLVKGLLDSLSTTISEMLQYGVSPKDIARMYRGQKYEPSGFVSGHPYIKSVDSISDLISKIIDIELNDFTFCQVKPEGWKPEKEIVLPLEFQNKIFTANDYVQGEVCKNCNSPKLVQNGTCKVCTVCGSTTGCS